MKNRINTRRFKEIIEVGTMNNAIDGLQLRIGKRIKSCMISGPRRNISGGRDVVVSIDTRNNLTNNQEEIILNLADPYQAVLPYINDLPEKIEYKIENCPESDEPLFLILRNGVISVRIGLCKKQIIHSNIYNDNHVEGDEKLLTAIRVNKHILNVFDSLNKIGRRFGKIYTELKDNQFSFWVGDINYIYSNRVSAKIKEVEHEDFIFCFQFENFEKLRKFMHAGSMLKLIFVPETENNNAGGIIKMSDGNSDYTFYLINREL